MSQILERRRRRSKIILNCLDTLSTSLLSQFNTFIGVFNSITLMCAPISFFLNYEASPTTSLSITKITPTAKPFASHHYFVPLLVAAFHASLTGLFICSCFSYFRQPVTCFVANFIFPLQCVLCNCRQHEASRPQSNVYRKLKKAHVASSTCHPSQVIHSLDTTAILYQSHLSIAVLTRKRPQTSQGLCHQSVSSQVCFKWTEAMAIKSNLQRMWLMQLFGSFVG